MARYFGFDAAYRAKLTVLSMRTAGGVTLVDGEAQRRRLALASASDRNRNWVATIPFSLFVALVVCLGLEARAALSKWLARIRPKSLNQE